MIQRCTDTSVQVFLLCHDTAAQNDNFRIDDITDIGNSHAKNIDHFINGPDANGVSLLAASKIFLPSQERSGQAF